MTRAKPANHAAATPDTTSARPNVLDRLEAVIAWMVGGYGPGDRTGDGVSRADTRGGGVSDVDDGGGE